MSDSARPYVLVASPHSVAVWAGYPIQFEGMRRFDWQNTLVTELKAALELVSLVHGQALSGFYGCTVPTRCDTENRLFTNPGAATFPAGTISIRWERVTEVPTPPVTVNEIDGLHFYRYAPTTSWQLWQPESVLARWHDVPRRLPHDGSARPTWLALREAVVAGDVEMFADTLPVGMTFGVRIEVCAPARGPRSAPALSEAVVDGVLCALHEGAPTTVAGAIAHMMHAKLGAITLDHLTNLIEQRGAILPGSPFRHSNAEVRLSPLDEYCDAGEVTIRRDRPSLCRT